MTDTFELTEIIKDSGLKKDYIAKQLGISPQALLNKITNKSEFKASEMDKLSELLSIDSKKREEIFFHKM